MPGFSVSSEFNSLGLEHTAWSEEPVLGTLVLSFLLVHVVYFLQKVGIQSPEHCQKVSRSEPGRRKIKRIPGGGG